MKYVGLGVILLVFLASLMSLRWYGMRAENPFLFLRGQSFLHAVTSGQGGFVQPRLPSPVFFVPGQRISSYNFHEKEARLAGKKLIVEIRDYPSLQNLFKEYEKKTGRQSLYKHNAWSLDFFLLEKANSRFGPVNDVFSSGLNKIFYEKLGLVGDTEAYFLAGVIFFTLTALVIFTFALKIFGRLAALLSLTSFVLGPVVFAESHYNIPDVSFMFFLTAALLAFYFYYLNPTRKRTVFFIVLSLLALASNSAAILIFPITVITVLAGGPGGSPHSRSVKKRLVLVAAAGLLQVTLFVFFWSDSLKGIVGIFNNILHITIGSPVYLFQGVSQLSSKKTHYQGIGPVIYLLTQVPVVTILAAGVGLALLFNRSKSLFALFFAWITLSVSKAYFILTPSDSIRDIFELLPVVAIGAGYGIANVIKSVRAKTVVVLVYSVALLIIFLNYLPNGNVYFNFLAGGPKGAAISNLLTWQTAGESSFRQAVDWLNTHAEPRSRLAYLDGTMLAISPRWLRNDIAMGSYFSGFAAKGEYVISHEYRSPPQVFEYLYLKRYLKPVYTVSIQGVPLTIVWKNAKEFYRPGFEGIKTVTDGYELERSRDRIGEYLEIKFSRTNRIRSVTFYVGNWANCDNRQGVFLLKSYFIPQEEVGSTEVKYYFPAETTDRIRYYAFSSQSCVLKSRVESFETLN
ncbi:hypothetical protein HY214_02960 [Candidatus Roizmanbacteria bacterium]|nr:hypothetical protein [Candidatus Roizmanbacteria bacterium]